ncbi:MAG: tRNA (adenosine(37)-N6)-threonylcarbamoyltransferase complex transferase subunit TsaD, partial [Christensenellales bacterium]
KTVALAGGVAANSYLRDTITNECQKNDLQITYPSLILCTDNAAMIGSAGYYNLINDEGISYDLSVSPNPSLKL